MDNPLLLDEVGKGTRCVFRKLLVLATLDQLGPQEVFPGLHDQSCHHRIGELVHVFEGSPICRVDLAIHENVIPRHQLVQLLHDGGSFFYVDHPFLHGVACGNEGFWLGEDDLRVHLASLCRRLHVQVVGCTLFHLHLRKPLKSSKELFY